MSTQGVNNIPSADVPQILTQGAGTSAPIQDYGENGAAVPERSLTALFNQSGQYVGSYGLDPSTGALQHGTRTATRQAFKLSPLNMSSPMARRRSESTVATPFSTIRPGRLSVLPLPAMQSILLILRKTQRLR